ncbi:hypothetical protein ASPWEDRAFT_458281 [Aspergillus wentii DTO 134E9]|uniref:Altered inheritance of mitochondria protein 6 n=1 Tax=Aspergillus wentii DTO 134E9 TaxID=1073089 RepID=A0A1L9RRD5_ASPWE|nr:uncharacterized protein ASPWEDRAFT_458281 [Aspergillus wentii DTO 134E9]OJJ37526.1 hypothetical protein ASPWEDRAFT_458281 [Aspergillus wentii DTO 134E9]
MTPSCCQSLAPTHHSRGIIQFIVITCGIVITFFPDEFDRASNYWHHRHHNLNTAEAVSHWPTDISRDITPIGCHSHNDYWRRVPLFSALQAGCISVEADVWLFDDDLYVGHTTSALAPKRTLRTMYIEPLLRVLDKQNPTTHFNRDRHAASASASRAQGVFDTDPAQTLVLLIDFKTDGPATWSHVVAQLSPLRERGYLTHFNGKEVIPGPVTVVGTGNTPFDLLTSVSTYRDIFFDAPLDVLIDDNNTTSTQYQDEGNQAPQNTIAKPAPTGNRGQGLSGTSADMIINPNTFNTTNSYYASVSFRKSIGMPWQFHLSDQQMARIRKHVQAAHSHGLKVRYWGIPSWPRSLRNHIWTVLARESVDILNVDDLESAARKDWRPSLFDWWS